VQWQSAAATPLSVAEPAFKSGVALRFPPHSKRFAQFGCGFTAFWE